METENKIDAFNITKNVIQFSYNWNNKLGCKSYTTIRLKSERYKIGNTYNIYLKGLEQIEAKIINIKEFKLKDLNDYMAYLDTGYGVEETKLIIHRMYKNISEDQIFYFILLSKTKLKKNFP